METPDNSISDILESADWDTLANALAMADCGIDGNDAKSRNIRAKLGIIRIIIYENIRKWNGGNTIDLSFLMGTYKTIRTMEKEFEEKKIENREFLVFLKLLLDKFERQKIIVKKPLAARSEFGKMKGVVEDEFTSL